MAIKKFIVIGASSGIGRALCAELIALGHVVGACARNRTALEEMKERFGERFHFRELDIREIETIPSRLMTLIKETGGMDVCILSASISRKNPDLAWSTEQDVIQTNVTGYAACAVFATNYFVGQDKGHLVGITSIARKFGFHNPAYNASKAFEDIYLQGLSLRYRKKGMRLTIIRPGFVQTPMTEGNPRMFWVEQPETAARYIVKAIEKKKIIAYITPRWQVIEWLINLLPFRLLKKIL